MLNASEQEFIAHFRQADGSKQYVQQHLDNVAAIAARLTAKIGLPEAGRLLGLLHDLGKYSTAFQRYIQSATELLNPDVDDQWVDAVGLKGKIDHSTAGAQWIWQRLHKLGPEARFIGQTLAVCLASHHGGMLDCLQPGGDNGFQKRVNKADDVTHLNECLDNVDKEVLASLDRLASEQSLKKIWQKIVAIVGTQPDEPDRLKMFRLGFFSRFLFSCLIDADRIDSADFENPANKKMRQQRTAEGKPTVDWQTAIDRMEGKLASFTVRNEVDKIRCQVSRQCLERAAGPQGIYTLTVPTGGGKTFASMRYALHHAKKHRLDHIIYIIPYTSIIEQNAEVIREVLEDEDDKFPWVLEHHSNLEPEVQTWHSKLASENWEAPIIFTTMVQFLETMFGSGTRGARRLHNLTNSVIIFDEIQNLPVNCVHLFNNGLRFLVEHGGSTAVLCTATQPLLGGVNPVYGALPISVENEIVDDTKKLFQDLQRQKITNLLKPGGWSKEEIQLSLQNLHRLGCVTIEYDNPTWNDLGSLLTGILVTNPKATFNVSPLAVSLITACKGK